MWRNTVGKLREMLLRDLEFHLQLPGLGNVYCLTSSCFWSFLGLVLVSDNYSK